MPATLRLALAVAGMALLFFCMAFERAPDLVAPAGNSFVPSQTSYFSPLLSERGDDDAPAAPRPANGPVPPVQAADRQTHRDLASLFDQLAQSDGIPDLKQAVAILDRCTALIDRDRGHSTDVQLAVDQQTTYAQQVSARTALDDRCRGFRRLGSAEMEVRRQSIHARLTAQGLGSGTLTHGGDALLAAGEIRHLLAQPNAGSYEEARPALTRALARRLGAQEDSAAWEDVQVSLLLVACEIGASCGKDSFDALQRCLYQGRCDAGLYDHWAEGLPPERVAQVERLRDTVTRALRQQDYQMLGL